MLGSLVAATGCRTVAPARLASFEAAADPDLSGFHVRRPGPVLVDAARQRRRLAALPPEERVARCGVHAGEWPEIDPVPALVPQADGRPDGDAQPMALLMMEAGAAYLADADPSAAHDAVVETLDRWAGADALLAFESSDSNLYYALDRALLPTLVTWSLVRSDSAVSERRRRRIDGWLERLVIARGPMRPARSATDDTTRNNHAYLAASVDMAWGALMGDGDAFRRGPAAYRMAVRDMRLDGSLPQETSRGARALWYQRHALASLTVIAEMAAVQGHDLYGYSLDGRSLHRAIRFLLDAIDRPSIVARYALANHKPGPERDPAAQDLGFLRRRGTVRHYMAWVELYAARFPDRDETRRLLGLLARQDQPFRPMVDDYSGGATSCFVA